MQSRSDVSRKLATLAPEVRARLAQQAATSTGTATPAGQQRPPARRAGDRVPLSFAQQRLWFVEQVEEGAVHHNDGILLIIRGEVDLTAMNRSVEEIIRRHEILRTSFLSDEDGPHQVVGPPWSLTIEESVLPDAAPTSDDPILTQAFQREMARPLDLAQGRLVRAVLYRLGPGRSVLGVIVHHLVCDLWSFDVFASELGVLYPGFLPGGEPVTLPELATQYADYAIGERETLDERRLASRVERRVSALTGAPPVLTLPTRQPRPATQRFVGSAEWFRVDRAVTDRVREWSQAQGVTLYMSLLTAFKVLLARYTGSRDIMVASPTAIRESQDVERLIGCFVNMIIMRTDLAGEPTFADAVARVRDACLDAYADRDIPFERLVMALAPTRTRSHHPVVQAAFVLQKVSSTTLRMSDLEIEFHNMDTGRSRMDLSVRVTERAEGLIGEIEYDVDLFTAHQIRSLARGMERLLAACTDPSDRSVWDLPLLAQADVDRMVHKWNDTAAPAGELLIHRAFEAQAARTPDADALVTDAERLTYQELDQRANRVAHHLLALGVSVEQRVAVCMPRSADEVAAILAILKVGAVYVPISPKDSPERRDELTLEAGASIVISVGELADEMWAPGRHVLDLDVERDDIDRRDDTAPAVDMCPDNLAYVIFTSGSTGQSKGVLIPHRGFVNRMDWGQRNYPLDGTHRVLRKAAATFDVSLDELFRALMYGAASVQLPDTAGFDPRRLAETIATHQVTDADFSPTALRELLLSTAPDRLRSLRRIVSGVEALPVETARLVHDSLDVALFNLYGPTEVSVSCTCWPVHRNEGQRPVVPIGRPMDNVRVYVVDESGRLAPPGAAGELYVGGAGLARGYLGMPGLTASAFVPDPWSGEPGTRLYRTGDLVRWTFEGSADDCDPWPSPALQFLGRVDRQLKVRGYRVEPSQVEVVLRSVPGVQDAAVTVDANGTRTIGHLVCRRLPDTAVLREHLRKRLPDYMMPSRFTQLDALPYTAHGKIDYAALPAPAEEVAPPAETAPRNHTEEVLTAIWCQVLEREHIGLHDSFFDLGGDSLSATRILTLAETELGVYVEVAAIFDHPTIAELARRFAD